MHGWQGAMNTAYFFFDAWKIEPTLEKKYVASGAMQRLPDRIEVLLRASTQLLQCTVLKWVHPGDDHRINERTSRRNRRQQQTCFLSLNHVYTDKSLKRNHFISNIFIFCRGPAVAQVPSIVLKFVMQQISDDRLK